MRRFQDENGVILQVDIPDWYQTIAEIGIGLAGFSGLAVALRKRAGPLSEIQIYRMSILFALSLGAMFLSLLPHVAHELGIGNESTWIVASLAMLIWSGLFLYWWIASSRRIARAAPEIFNWRAFATMAAGHTINLLLQLSVVLSLFDTVMPGIFGAGLIWYLIHASQQFARMLFIQPRNEND